MYVVRRALPWPALTQRADVSKRFPTSRHLALKDLSEGCHATTGARAQKDCRTDQVTRPGDQGVCLAETGLLGAAPKPRRSVTVSTTQRIISTTQLYSYYFFTTTLSHVLNSNWKESGVATFLSTLEAGRWHLQLEVVGDLEHASGRVSFHLLTALFIIVRNSAWKKKLYVFICTSLVDTPEGLNDRVVEVSREHKCFNAK